MIPLRRQLIVEEHGTLMYPEGTACADVLIAGRAGRIVCQPRISWPRPRRPVHAVSERQPFSARGPIRPDYQPDLGPQHLLKGAAIRADATPEYLGVGYIIGARVAGAMFAGGVFSWLVLMPAIYFFGSHLAVRSIRRPAHRANVAQRVVGTYVRPMGAGAVAASG